MKKIILMAIMALATTGAKAQQYVGGGIGFASTSDESAFSITPEYGRKINDTFCWGGRLGFSTSGSGDSRYTAFSIEPYIRHNLMAIGNVNVILDYELSYTNSGVKDNKTNTFFIGVEPGLLYNVNNKLSVVAHVGIAGFQTSKLDVDGAEAVNTFLVRGSSSNLGFSVFYNF